jgi:hypothetical protein
MWAVRSSEAGENDELVLRATFFFLLASLHPIACESDVGLPKGGTVGILIAFRFGSLHSEFVGFISLSLHTMDM